MLRKCGARRGALTLAGTHATNLPGCFAGFEVIVGDGKKIKSAVKPLKRPRGYSGKRTKAPVAILRRGTAVVMGDSVTRRGCRH